MSKNVLDSLYICDLYQIDEDTGYIERDELYNKYGISDKLDHLPFCKKIGRVIVKKSSIFKYNLREVLTGVPLETVYEDYNSSVRCDWYTYTAKGNKKEYDTFILIGSLDRKVSLNDINTYCDEHSNTEEYRKELISLINRGKENHAKKKHDEKQENDRVNSIAYQKLYRKSN